MFCPTIVAIVAHSANLLAASGCLAELGIPNAQDHSQCDPMLQEGHDCDLIDPRKCERSSLDRQSKTPVHGWVGHHPYLVP